MAKEVGADSRSREPGLAARPDPTGFDRGEGMREALLAIADVWSLPSLPAPAGRRWHCQHEEWMAAASIMAAEAIATDNSARGGGDEECR